MKTLSRVMVALLLGGFGMQAAACAQQVLGQCPDGELLLDLPAGNFRIRYWDPTVQDPTVFEATYVPATKFQAVIQGSYSFDAESHLYTYVYAVTNQSVSEQEIRRFLLAVDADVVPILDPVAPNASWLFYPSVAITKGVGWVYSAAAATSDPLVAGIKRGETLVFSIRSPKPPGQVTAYLQGANPIMELPEGSCPGLCVSELLRPFEMFPLNYVPSQVSGPVVGN